MNIKLIPDITVPICICNFELLKWYKRDAKRILSKKPWNSQKYNYVKDDFQVQIISDKNGNEINWLLHIGSNYNKYGERLVTPMYEVDLMNRIKLDYWRIKKK
jgi:hypothetical protein